MIQVNIMSDWRDRPTQLFSLPEVPREGDLIQISGSPFLIRAVEWVPDADYINVLIGR